ncbi:MAG: hypothetical protein ACKOZT_03590 [Cyanobium sp.]
MAEYPMPDNTPQRYADLERAYVEERWSSVRGNGEGLLEELEDSDDPQAEALAHRVRVLLGHAHLYGLGEPEVAEDYYRDVIAGNAEAELRQIAAQGLQQCQQPTIQPTSAAPQAEAAAPAPEPDPEPEPEPAPQSIQPAPSITAEPLAPELEATAPQDGTARPSADPFAVASGSPAPSAAAKRAASGDPFQAAVAAALATGEVQRASEPAMPWLKDLPGGAPDSSRSGALVPRLEVEVVEEPELLEVAQADPSLAEELELELSRIRERRAATAAATADNTAPETGPETAPEVEAAPPQAEDSREDGFAAAIAAATAEVADVADVAEMPAVSAVATDPPGAEPMAEPLEPIAEALKPAVPMPSSAAASPDLSQEDPDLVAGLLRVVLNR